MKFIFLICTIVFCCSAAPAQEVAWQIVQKGKEFQLSARIVDDKPTPGIAGMQVYVGEHTHWPGEEMSAVLGEIVQDGTHFIFRPSFSFRPGLTYTAFWEQSSPYVFSIPASGDRPRVVQVFPSDEEVPANLLKIYLHFSAPMGEGQAYQQLLLTNATGDTIHQPFVPLQPELWSEDRRRLTLWLDPGRVKRGLLSHEMHGVVLAPEEAYILTIQSGWKAINGNILGKSYEKKIRVKAPDYKQPDPAHWSVSAPHAGTTEPLVIHFGEAMDHALAPRLIRVLNDAERAVAGSVELTSGERQWHFVPDEAWQRGDYFIVINTDLEDLAGNNLNRPFERDMGGGSRKEMEAKDFVRLKVEVLRVD